MLSPLSTTLLLLAGAALAAPAAEPQEQITNVAPSLLAPVDASKFHYYPAKTPLSGPCDLTTGPDNAIWVQDIIQNIILRIDPETGATEELTIPYHDHTPANFTLADLLPDKLALACAIQPGEDGNLYAASGIRGQFLRITPSTRQIKVYQPPFPASVVSNLENFNDLWRAKDGMYFTLTTANTLFFFDYAKETFTPYSPPTPNAGVLGVYLASDGGIWTPEFFANKIARFDPSSKTWKEFPIPSVRSLLPAVIRAESPKGKLWFTGLGGQSMIGFDIASEKFDIVPDNALPPGAPTEDTVDPQGRVWWSTLARPSLQYLDPKKNDEITYIRQPTVNPAALTIAVHYSPLKNSIWFTETANNRVGRYQL